MRQRIGRSERLQYFRAAASFWREAARIQATRASTPNVSSSQARLDLSFYLVAVIRLREVAWQLQRRERLPGMRGAVKAFDIQWPRVRELRNADEHMAGRPSGLFPAGIWYFGSSAIDGRPDGSVEYMIDAELTELDLDRLVEAIHTAVDAELSQRHASR